MDVMSRSIARGVPIGPHSAVPTPVPELNGDSARPRLDHTTMIPAAGGLATTPTP